MPITLAFPRTAAGFQTVKDQIIAILGASWPHSMRKIVHIITKENATPVTYQAIYKALHQLIDEKVVTKNNDLYSLNVEWIEKIRNYSEQLYLNYSSQQLPSGSMEVINLKFNSLCELEQFVLWKFTSTFSNPGRKPSVGIWNHVWPGIGLSSSDLNHIADLLKDENMFAICKGNTYLDRLWGKWLNQLGLKMKFDIEINSMYDIFVKGDYVCQSYLSDALLKSIHETYEAAQGVESVDIYRIVNAVAMQRIEIHTTLIKNSELANQIREKVISHF